MTYQVYKNIYIIAAILAIVFLLITIFLFFFLKIINVIGDLTGANARKAIDEIANQTTNQKSSGYSANKDRAKLTSKISPSGRLNEASSDALGSFKMTEKIGTQKLSDNETTVLNATNETTVLTSNETTVLSSNNETTVLGNSIQSVEKSEIENIFDGFKIEYEITFVHTNEYIA